MPCQGMEKLTEALSIGLPVLALFPPSVTPPPTLTLDGKTCTSRPVSVPPPLASTNVVTTELNDGPLDPALLATTSRSYFVAEPRTLKLPSALLDPEEPVQGP